MAPVNFFTLPAELRNEIYEIAFITNTDSKDGATPDLRNTKPPSKALLLTCRQIYNEATKIYQEAYRKYWCESQFELDLDKVALGKQGREAIKAISPEDFAHISHLHIRRTLRQKWVTSVASERRDIYRVLNGWRCEHYDDDVLDATMVFGFYSITPGRSGFRIYQTEDLLATKHPRDRGAVLDLSWVELEELLKVIFY